MRKPELLIVDPDDQANYEKWLPDYQLTFCAGGRAALDQVDRCQFDLAIVDWSLNTSVSGSFLIYELHRKHAAMPIIVVDNCCNPNISNRSREFGATTMLLKPLTREDLCELVADLLSPPPPPEVMKRIENTPGLIGDSAAWRKAMVDLARILASPVGVSGSGVVNGKASNDKVINVVLISGETGVGKDMMAMLIRDLVAPKGPFIAMNIGASNKDTLANELFGHDIGAFTSANKETVGRFKAATDGMLFLNEIGELDPHCQTTLLQVLDGNGYQRVGSSQHTYHSGWVVVGTNRSLAKDVATGKFREDLYYRIKSVRKQ